MTKVKVIATTSGNEWYADRIGEVFEVSEESHPVGDGVMAYVDGDLGDIHGIRDGNYEVVSDSNRKHYIADGKYGATLEREYEEVAGNADVGDYVTRDEVVRKVTKRSDLTDGIEFDGYMEYDEEEGEDVEVIGWNHGYYTTLRPTQPEVVRYKGGRYELAERKAEVGELVVVVNVDSAKLSSGDVVEIFEVRDYENDSHLARTSEFCTEMEPYEYLVLEPIEKPEENSPKSTEDLLANLARRVTELERENKQLRQDYEVSDKQTEKWAENVNRKIRTMQRDLETFAQTASNAEVLAKQADENTKAQPTQNITVNVEEKDEISTDELAKRLTQAAKVIRNGGGY